MIYVRIYQRSGIDHRHYIDTLDHTGKQIKTEMLEPDGGRFPVYSDAIRFINKHEVKWVITDDNSLRIFYLPTCEELEEKAKQ